jgi:hypothetical protein
VNLQDFLQQVGPAPEIAIKQPANVIEKPIIVVVPTVATTPAPLPPVADGFERIALNAGEEMFLIEAPHAPEDWTDPERKEAWASKRQLAQTAADLAAQAIVGKQAYRMATIAGYTAKEAGYIAKLIRDGDWRAILEEKHVMPKPDRLAALLAAA